MSCQLLVSVSLGETRIALRRDGRLIELAVERPEATSLIGNVYLGRVIKVLPGVEAAFVDCGLGRSAFLPACDATPDGLDSDPHARIATCVHEGQTLLVQVIKDPTGDKGARVSTRIALPGRYLVFAPHGTGVAVSRRIRDEQERARLVSLVDGVNSDDRGFIVRTAGEGAVAEAIARDATNMRSVWANIESAVHDRSPPCCVYNDLDPVCRYLRDRMNYDVVEVLIDDRATLEAARDFCRQTMPHLADRLSLFVEPEPLFDAFGVEDDISGALTSAVRLACGGTLVIEETEALTVIDVNTARFTGVSTQSDTALRTNLEAAGEIAHQLRLRNIGGIVVIDFIGMQTVAHRERILQALTHALAEDPAPSRVYGLSELGLVEMTRKRTRDSLHQIMTDHCGACGGRGRIKSAETIAAEIGRAVTRAAAGARGNEITIVASPEIFAWLSDRDDASWWAGVKRAAGTRIALMPDPTFSRERFDVAT